MPIWDVARYRPLSSIVSIVLSPDAGVKGGKLRGIVRISGKSHVSRECPSTRPGITWGGNLPFRWDLFIRILSDNEWKSHGWHNPCLWHDPCANLRSPRGRHRPMRVEFVRR